MNHRLALAGSLALLVVLSGCERPDTTVSTLGSTRGFDVFVEAAARKKVSELTSEEQKQAVDQYIGMQVAAAEAAKLGLEKDVTVQSQLELARMNTLSEALLKKYLETNPITDADVAAEYNSQVTSAPPEYRARHILVDDKALAEALIAKLQAGGDFAALAKEHSKDASKASGGDLGWFTAQSMVKPFADAVAVLTKGSYTTAPVQSQFGWHVIQLEDTRAPSLPPLTDVKDQVKQLVTRKRLQAHLVELRKTSPVEADKQLAALTAYASSPPQSSGPSAGPTPAPAAAPPPPAP